MFFKFTLKSFFYDMIDILLKIRYNKYRIIKCFLYQNLTDMDSCSSTNVFVCFDNCEIKESLARTVIFEILIEFKILESLDTSNKFWKQFKGHRLEFYKQAGLY